MRSVRGTLHDLLDRASLSDLCPRLALVERPLTGLVPVDALGFGVDELGRPAGSVDEPCSGPIAGLIRIHTGIDPADGRALRMAHDRPWGRLLDVAAGGGVLAVGPDRLVGSIRALDSRTLVAFSFGREDVEAVMVEATGRRVRFLSPTYFGAVTIDVVGGGERELVAHVRRHGYGDGDHKVD